MKTDDLINVLSYDTRPDPPVSRTLLAAIGIGYLGALALVIVGLRPRPDLLQVLPSWRFLTKFVLSFSVAVSAFELLRGLSRPDHGSIRQSLIAIPAALLVSAVGLEMFLTPTSTWTARLLGSNNGWCLLFVPLLSLLPLGACLAALRKGASTRPLLTGAVAGVLSGAVGSMAYALHCTDDSPFFFVVWYSLGVGLISVAGTYVGRWCLRW